MKHPKHPLLSRLLPFLLALLLALCLLTPAAPAEESPEAAPLAAVPETPPGMTAHDLAGFVFFVPEGWTEDEPVNWAEDEPEDSASHIRVSMWHTFRRDEDGPALAVALIGLSGQEDLTPGTFIGGVLLAAAMGTEDGQQPTIEGTSLRGVPGVLVTDPALHGPLWMGQHGSMVVFLGVTGGDEASPAELRALLFQALGVTEDEVAFMDPA